MSFGKSADSELAQSRVEGGLFVGTLFALSDDKRTAYGVVACRKMLEVAAGNHHAARRHIAAVVDGLGIADVDDVGAAGYYGVGTKHSLGTDVSTLNHDAAGTDENTLLYLA